MLKSGTSISANIEEAIGAQSKSDFMHKIAIACKESGETSYWPRLYKNAEIMELKLAQSFLSGSEKLKKILSSILKQAKGFQELKIRFCELKSKFLSHPNS